MAQFHVGRPYNKIWGLQYHKSEKKLAVNIKDHQEYVRRVALSPLSAYLGQCAGYYKVKYYRPALFGAYLPDNQHLGNPIPLTFGKNWL